MEGALILFIPLVNLFVEIFHVFLYQAALQRIYNNQKGITSKEEVKNRVHNKNTVVN